MIHGTLPGLNEYTKANRSNRFMGASMKRKAEELIVKEIRYCELHHENVPVFLEYTWYEPNNRRDQDNVSFAQKFVQDALVEAGILTDDSRKYLVGAKHTVLTDKENPRVEVVILRGDDL